MMDFDFSVERRGGVIERIDEQIALLLATRAGTLPLDREFGLSLDYVDMLPEVAKSLYVAEITEKVNRFIPSVRVEEVVFDSAPSGQIIGRVVITSA